MLKLRKLDIEEDTATGTSMSDVLYSACAMRGTGLGDNINDVGWLRCLSFDGGNAKA